jgi:aromatic-L-amino-acid decarboxylase
MIDPVQQIGANCQKLGVWLHVDAAMSGTAALCPEFRYIHGGMEYADSYCFNPHKWMFTNFDCDCFYVADRAALIRTMSILPEYLRNQATASGAVIDYRDWQIPLGRRFRSLKLWFVLRHYGIEGSRFHIREYVRLASTAGWARRTIADRRLAPLNLVCFRLKASDEANQRLMDAPNRTGDLYLTHTRLNDWIALRMSIDRRARRAVRAECLAADSGKRPGKWDKAGKHSAVSTGHSANARLKSCRRA